MLHLSRRGRGVTWQWSTPRAAPRPQTLPGRIAARTRTLCGAGKVGRLSFEAEGCLLGGVTWLSGRTRTTGLGRIRRLR